MKLLRPMGYGGTVYRPGQEAELAAAIAEAKATAEREKKPAAEPNFAALAAAGIMRLEDEPAPADTTDTGKSGKSGKSGKGKPATPAES